MKKRSYFFDNAKFILIILVVWGHLLRTYIHDEEMINALYKTIYSFHMPAFIFIAGFFARSIYKKGYFSELFKKLIIPYMIFQGAYSVLYYVLEVKSDLSFNLFEPHWSLWFLISLFCWNIIVILFSRMTPFLGLSISILIGLLVGFFDEISHFLSLSRTFVFLPMFLLGYYLDMNTIQKLHTVKVRMISLIIMLLTFIIFYTSPNLNYEWLLGSKPYSELLDFTLVAMLTRFIFYIVSTIMVLSFLSLIPNREYFFTKLGKRTLYVYLLHGFFIQIFRESHLSDQFTNFENYLLLGGFALALTFLLSSNFVYSLAQPFIELGTSRIKKLYFKWKWSLYYMFQK